MLHLNSGHVEDWTATEVGDFLVAAGLEAYSLSFQENEITGDVLIHLDHSMLKELGVSSVGHRVAILKAIFNIKVDHRIVLDEDHYMPKTAEPYRSAQVPSSDSISEQSKAQLAMSKRLESLEHDIKQLTDTMSRFKEELQPINKIVNEFKPLPTPDITNAVYSGSSLSRKFSTKKLFLGVTPRQASPVPTVQIEPESPDSPKKYFDRTGSPNLSLPRLPEDLSFPAGKPMKAAIEDANHTVPAAAESFKSFRVGLDDPCYQVLRAALRKYKIQTDWREYSLFICYADQERCLSLDEKPLLIFQQLQREHKNPVFMLRRQGEKSANALSCSRYRSIAKTS